MCGFISKRNTSQELKMRIAKCVIIIFFVIILVMLNANILISQVSNTEKPKLQVIYSKNIEVFCTLINLTDFWEKRPSTFPFAIETRERFLPYQNHEAVKMTQKFFEKQ